MREKPLELPLHLVRLKRNPTEVVRKVSRQHPDRIPEEARTRRKLSTGSTRAPVVRDAAVLERSPWPRRSGRFCWQLAFGLPPEFLRSLRQRTVRLRHRGVRAPARVPKPSQCTEHPAHRRRPPVLRDCDGLDIRRNPPPASARGGARQTHRGRRTPRPRCHGIRHRPTLHPLRRCPVPRPRWVHPSCGGFPTRTPGGEPTTGQVNPSHGGYGRGRPTTRWVNPSRGRGGRG
jgi:hypothetical protein